MDKIYDVVILGGGPAGYTSALYAARAGLDTLVIEKMSVGGQMTLTGDIDNYPGFPDGIDGFSLGMSMQSGAERFGAETVYDEVLSVDFGGQIKKIKISSGEICAKAVIIATGANPRELGLTDESNLTGKGVHYCAHCDGRFYKDKTVAVVGGGNSAAQDALYLSRLAKKVYLIHRRDTLRATKIYHKPLLETENVEFLWDSSVQEFIVEDKFAGVVVKNLKTQESKNVLCDGLFISIGRKPATEFLNGAVALDKNGYVLADENCKTDIGGVFVAGDVRTKILRQVVTAVSDCAVAASMAEEYITEKF